MEAMLVGVAPVEAARLIQAVFTAGLAPAQAYGVFAGRYETWDASGRGTVVLVFEDVTSRRSCTIICEDLTGASRVAYLPTNVTMAPRAEKRLRRDLERALGDHVLPTDLR
jgi:hypothetical protein